MPWQQPAILTAAFLMMLPVRKAPINLSLQAKQSISASVLRML